MKMPQPLRDLLKAAPKDLLTNEEMTRLFDATIQQTKQREKDQRAARQRGEQG
jgi:hypothetical protein